MHSLEDEKRADAEHQNSHQDERCEDDETFLAPRHIRLRLSLLSLSAFPYCFANKVEAKGDETAYEKTEKELIHILTRLRS